MERRDVQSQQHAIPPDGSAYQRGLQQLSREQQLHHATHSLLLPGHDQSEPRGRRIPDELSDLPHHVFMAGSHVQPYLVPHESWRRKRRVHYVPYESLKFCGIRVHQLPHQVANRPASPGRARLRLQQSELLPMSSQWIDRRIRRATKLLGAWAVRIS